MSSSGYKPWQVALAVVPVVGLIILYLAFGDDVAERSRKADAFEKSLAADKDTERASALQAIKAEPKVLDVAWEGASLWAGVLDDGTSRDGYAAYLCEVVREAKATPVVIRVKDVQSGRTLGSNNCR